MATKLGDTGYGFASIEEIIKDGRNPDDFQDFIFGKIKGKLCKIEIECSK